MYCRPLTDAHRPRSACRNVRTWPPGCVRFFVSPAGCREWSSSSPSRSSRQFLPERLGQFLRGQVPARPRTGSISSSKKRKKGSRKETPAIRNHWFDKMHQSAEEGGRQRCSSISSNHPDKNGWDEHSLVIFRKPTHLHTENEGWPRRRRGEGDLNRRRVGRAHRPRAGGPPPAAPSPSCVPSLGRPVKAIPLGRIL